MFPKMKQSSRLSAFFIPVMAALMGVVAVAAVHAQSGTQIGTSGRWDSHSAEIGGKKICFITSIPTRLEGQYERSNRGETRVHVTHHPDDGQRGVVSSVAGYDFKEGSDVTFAIDGQKYKLLGVGSRAWGVNPEQDGKMVAAMKRGNTLVVTGTSSRGNITIDTYSLTGFTRAMGQIDKECPA